MIYVKQFVETAPMMPRGKSAFSRLPKTGKQDVSKEEVQTSQNETSRLPETGSADFPKGEASYKNHNQTDLSYTDPSIHPPDDREIEESVREQIDYPLLAQSYPYDDPDCLLELICEVLTSTAPAIRIGSENIPTPKVQDRFRKLTFEHIAYVLDALRETTTKYGTYGPIC